MKKWIQVLLVMLTLCIANWIAAQDTNSIKKWTLLDCFDYAAAHNIEINTLRLSEQSYIQDLTAAKGVKIPSLNGTVGNTFNNANNNVSGNNVFVNQLNSTGVYSINSSIVLWNSNYINNNIRQNNLLVLSAGLSVKQFRNNIILSISQAYLNILLAKENLKYISNLAATSDSMVRQGQLLYDAGSVAKINLLQLQAQYSSDKYLQVQTENAIRQNTLLLKQLLQLPTDSTFDINTPVSLTTTEILPSLSSVQEKAIHDFPEIKIGQLGIDIARLDIAKVQAGFRPVLSAYGAIGTGYSNLITNSSYPKTGYFTQTGDNFYQQLGFSLSIPIYSNLTNKTNLAKANIRYSQSALNLQNYELVLMQAVEQAYLNLSNAKQAYSAANEQLIAATESYRIINEQFKLGGTNTFEVLQLRNQYVQAVQAYTQAKYTEVLQQKIYEFYMGNEITL